MIGANNPKTPNQAMSDEHMKSIEMVEESYFNESNWMEELVD